MTNRNPSIIPYLEAHLRAHPSMEPRDVVKLCYQAAHGAEHLLADEDAARRYLEREMDSVEADGSLPPAEPISHDVARVNLAAWKARGLSADALFRLFAATASVGGGGEDRLEQYLTEATAFFAGRDGGEAWETFLSWYDGQGRPALHHSDAYRAAERPAYRIVLRRLLPDGLQSL